MTISLLDRWHAVWNTIFDDVKHYIRKEQYTNILAHLNENGIGSWLDPFFQQARKMQSENGTTKGHDAGVKPLS